MLDKERARLCAAVSEIANGHRASTARRLHLGAAAMKTSKEYPITVRACVWLVVPLAGCVDGAAPFCEGSDCVEGSAPQLANGDFATGDHVTFLNLAVQQNAASDRDGAVLADIVNHLPTSYGNQYYDDDQITWAHETTHGINSYVRNEMSNWQAGQNGFYVLEGRAVAIDDPDMSKSVVAGYVPSSLRGSRYDLYLVGQGDWDDMPTYILDEFVAYTNGGAAGVDLVQHGLWNAGWRDGVAGQLEFTVYAVALMMATEEHDADFFRTNTQFKEFIAWNCRRAMRIYREGKDLPDFRWETQDQYYEDMQSANDTADMRAFMRRVFGDAVTDEILGLSNGGGEPDPDPNPDPDPGDAGGDGNDDPGGNDPGDRPDLTDPLTPPPDGDHDGVANALDLCTSTPAGRRVWHSGEWIGCAGGEYRDRDLAGARDTDGDGIRDAQDLCSGTPLGRHVWRDGPWKGCAGGQYRDR